VIEALRTSILVLCDHLHIKQIRTLIGQRLYAYTQDF